MNPQLIQRNALKTAFGVTLAYVIALSLNWQNPVWAAFGVFFPRLPFFGMTFHKSILRLIGTFSGAILAVAIIGAFCQNPWVALAAISGSTGFWFYFARRSSNSYAMMVTGFTGYIIWSSTIFAPENTFSVATARISENCLGILIGMLTSALIWPDIELPAIRSKLEELRKSLIELSTALAQAADGDRDVISKIGPAETKVNGLTSGIESLFISSNRNSFQRYRNQPYAILFLKTRRLSAVFSAVRSLLQTIDGQHNQQFPLTAKWLSKAADALKAMNWADCSPPEDSKLVSNLQADMTRIENEVLSRVELEETSSDQASLMIALTDQLRLLTAELVDVAQILNSSNETNRADETKARVEITTVPVRPAQEDIRDSIVTAIAMAAAGAFWFLFNPPSGSSAFQFAGTVQMVLLSAPIFPYKQFFKALFGAIILTFPVVFFVLPVIDGIFQLSIVIFLAIYAISIVQELPGGALTGVLGFATFVGLLMIQEEQADYATLLPGFIAAVIAQLLGAHISLVVTRLFIPITPGQQLCNSLETSLEAASRLNRERSSKSTRFESETAVARRRSRLAGTITQLESWNHRLKGLMDAAAIDAFERVAKELRSLAGTLSALEVCRRTHLTSAESRLAELDGELHRRLHDEINQLRAIAKRPDSRSFSVDGMESEFDRKAEELLKEGRKNKDRGVVRSLSLVGHYRTTVATLKSLSSALRACDLSALKRHRFQ